MAQHQFKKEKKDVTGFEVFSLPHCRVDTLRKMLFVCLSRPVRSEFDKCGKLIITTDK